MSTVLVINHATTVASLYEAFGRGDIAFITRHVADDCQWIAAGGEYLPAGGTYRGKEAANFFKRLDESTSFSSFNVLAVNNINDHEVIAFGNMAGKSKKTGKSSASDWAMHWKFNEDGKVTYYHDYFDTAGAYIAEQ